MDIVRASHFFGVDLPMNVEPLGDKVVVKRIAAEEKTSGGIVLPENSRDKPAQGKVLSIGDGRLVKSGERVPPQVKEGDRVLFSQWAGTEIRVDGDELLIMSEDDILAIME